MCVCFVRLCVLSNLHPAPPGTNTKEATIRAQSLLFYTQSRLIEKSRKQARENACANCTYAKLTSELRRWMYSASIIGFIPSSFTAVYFYIESINHVNKHNNSSDRIRSTFPFLSLCRFRMGHFGPLSRVPISSSFSCWFSTSSFVTCKFPIFSPPLFPRRSSFFIASVLRCCLWDRTWLASL